MLTLSVNRYFISGDGKEKMESKMINYFQGYCKYTRDIAFQ
jgi:hypothetical protein